MTLLTICQDAANEIGVPSPSTVVGSTDTTNIQLLAAANREGKNLVAGYDWQTLIKGSSYHISSRKSRNYDCYSF